MAYEVMPYRGSELMLSDGRRAGRAVSRHRAGAVMRTSSVDAEADVVMAKIDNYTMATGAAMSAVVRVAEAQRQAELLLPETSGRLTALANDHQLGMSDLLADLRRDMRRR